MKKIFVFAIFAIALIALPFSGAAAERTTRDLVFEDDAAVKDTSEKDASGKDGSEKKEQTDGAAAARSIGVKTTILLTRDGTTSTVLPSHGFKSGDSVKLVFTPSIDGYVYWMAKGSSGNYTMLFPSAKSGKDNKVERNKEYTIPTKGAFRFDDKPGKEELLCILSDQQLPDLEKAMGVDDKYKSGSDKVAEMSRSNAEKRTTRDLVFEDEDSGDVNTKQQTAPKGEPFVAHYILTHE